MKIGKWKGERLANKEAAFVDLGRGKDRRRLVSLLREFRGAEKKVGHLISELNSPSEITRTFP